MFKRSRGSRGPRPPHKSSPPTELLPTLSVDLAQTMSQDLAKPPFLSIVEFVRKGNQISEKQTNGISQFLSKITPTVHVPITPDQIFHDFIPVADHSCSGFIDHIIVLLMASNDKLSQSALKFLHYTLLEASLQIQFEFTHSHFFTLLPTDYIRHPRYLDPRNKYHFLKIIRICIRHATSSQSARLAESLKIERSLVFQTVYENVLVPTQSVYDDVPRYWSTLNSSTSPFDFAELLGILIHIAPFHEHLLQLVRSTHICHTFISVLDSLEPLSLSKGILAQLYFCPFEWKHCSDHPSKFRVKELRRDLKIEGAEDAVELHLSFWTSSERETARQILSSFGCNNE